MNTRQVDKLIKVGNPITLHDTYWDETFTITIVGRDRWNIFSSDGGIFDRGQLELVNTERKCKGG